MASLFHQPTSRMVSASTRPHSNAMASPARKLRAFTSDGLNPMCGKDAAALQSKVVMSWLVTWYRRVPTDTFLSKIPIAPCYCQMMSRTLKDEIRITQYNNPTKVGKYSLEDLFRASDNIPHHYPKF